MAIEVGEFIERVRSSTRHGSAELVERAHEFAARAHAGHNRLTGEPFIQHPLEVANILFELGLDEPTLAAAMLHDVVEDCNLPIETIEKEFGPEVSVLVNGVTKLRRLDFRSAQEHKAENLRKMLLAMAQDVRVIIIKLADRLHNLRTLDPFPEARRMEIANETLQIFAPLANRLGILRLKWELEDLSFKYARRDEHDELVRRIQSSREERQHRVDEALALIRQRLQQAGIAAEVNGRTKHLYSIYNKLRAQEIDLERIYDLTAIRVIVGTVPECYHALGIVHDLWMPIQGLYTDHIAKPKPNGYQSLHTKVYGTKGEPLEVQIRTRGMHREAEFGIAAHWKYKEGGAQAASFEEKLRWLRQVLELQTEHQDSNEFLNALRVDLFKDQVFVFTPRGDVIDLPAGSTPIDFAYRIHSQVGHACDGAKVNGRIAPLNVPLQNGDICDVMTSKQSKGPKRDWLDFVVTAHARHRIKSHLRKQAFSEAVRAGHERLERAARAARLDPKAVMRHETLEKLAPQHNLKTSDDLLAAIGFGDISAERILEKIMAELKLAAPAEPPAPPRRKHQAARTAQGALSVRLSAAGVEDVMFSIARCCAPLPGDRVVGYVTRGRGVTLHRLHCKNLQAYRLREPDRIMEVEWRLSDEGMFRAEIAVIALDRVGLLNEITGVISGRHINIETLHTETGKDQRARMSIWVTVSNLDRLNLMLEDLRKLPAVMDAYRVTSAARRAHAPGALADVTLP